GVGGAVPQHHARPRAAVAGVGAAGQVAPLLRGHGDLAVSAGGVPPVDRAGEEAVVGHAHERRAGLEHVRVVGQHDVGHHGPGGRAGDVDLVRVAAVVLLGVGDHRHDADRVAAAVPGQRLAGGDVP